MCSEPINKGEICYETTNELAIYGSYTQQQMTVNHSFAVYVVDKQGNNRTFIGQDFKPDDLASYLEELVHA